MFLDIVPHQPNEDGTAVSVSTHRKRHKEMLLWNVGIQRGWKVLVMWPKDESELTILARLVGPHGQLVVLASEDNALAGIETAREDGAYQATAQVGRPVHPAFLPPRQVNVSLQTLLFNGRSLDFPDDAFDALWCGGMREVATAGAQDALIQEFYRVVRPGGLIALYQPGQPYQY